jgi:hypothetical protein
MTATIDRLARHADRVGLAYTVTSEENLDLVITVTPEGGTWRDSLRVRASFSDATHRWSHSAYRGSTELLSIRAAHAWIEGNRRVAAS